MPENLAIKPFSLSKFDTEQNLFFTYLILIVANLQQPIEKFTTLFNANMTKNTLWSQTLNTFMFKNSLFSS